jgi:hypothetical protein
MREVIRVPSPPDHKNLERIALLAVVILVLLMF